MVFMRLLSKYKLPEGSTLELITEPKARLLTLVEPEGRLYLDKIPNIKTIYRYYHQKIHLLRGDLDELYEEIGHFEIYIYLES